MVAAFLHHYTTTSRDPSAPTSVMWGLPVMPVSFCHTCASSCPLPNWECGSRDGFRLRQNRKLSMSGGCQVITALVEAQLPAVDLRGHQRKGISFSSSWGGLSGRSLPFAWSISHCCSSWPDDSSKGEQLPVCFPQEPLSFNSGIPESFSSFSEGKKET